MGLLAAVILPAIASYLLVSVLFPANGRIRFDFFLKIGFTVGLFYGLTSGSFFLAKAVSDDLGNLYILFEVALYAGIFVTCYSIRNRSRNRLPASGSSVLPPLRFGNNIFTILVLCAAAIHLSSFSIFALKYFGNEHGWWDAWAIWNMRARFLHLGGAHWERAFSEVLAYTHPDYPLLIPAGVARIWHYFHTDSTIIPAATAFVFTFAAVGLLTFSLAALKGPVTGLLAGLVLTGTYRFIEVGSYQIADVPIGFYFLAAIVALVLYDEYRSNGLLPLAGLMAGFSAWTKNEGILFLTALVLAVFVIGWIRRSWKYALRSLSFIVLGALPGLIMLMVFKIGYAPQTDIFESLSFGGLANHLVDISRHVQILSAFPGNLFKIAKIWLLILPLVFFLLGKSRERTRAGNGFGAALLVLLIMVIGYYGVYLITPHDLDWHLRTSIWRLIVQFWPAVLFLCFYRMNTAIFRNGFIFSPMADNQKSCGNTEPGVKFPARL